MILALLVALTAQDPRVSATVDRTEVLAGELLTLTVRIEADGATTVRIVDPPLTGLEVRGSREVTQVRMADGTARRVVTRELRLLAASPGRATIGPVRITHGPSVLETAPITVTVRTPVTAAAAGVAPRVRALVDSLRPPTSGPDVVVEVVAVPQSLPLGDQLDLLTLAWFPRDVRLQLRTPPTLDPPTVEGVWSYQQSTSPGVVTSRQAGGRWYDLYVSHQVVFPLTHGVVRVRPATVTYVQPLSYSFLTRELQHEVQSESLTVEVAPLPPAGRPAGFSGATGRDLTVSLDASIMTLPPGGAATITVSLTGVGNVALWPEPRIEWPAGLRTYPGDVAVDVEPRDGFVGGTKRFTYLVVADSGGTHLIPALSYPYFDPAARRYRVAGTRGLELIAPLGAAPAVERPLPPALLPRGAGTLSRRMGNVAGWLWVAAFALPPVVLLSLVAARRLRRALPGPAVALPTHDRLEALDRALRGSLAGLVGPASDEEGPALTAALRAAGVETSLAAHATRVRERLRQAVFGPTGRNDPDELSAEVNEVLRALAGETPGTARRAVVPVLTLVFLAAAPLSSQTAPRPEELYDVGAFRVAADSFAARTRSAPAIAAYWYNLGAAYYRMGEDGRARAAWLRAGRLAPRDPAIRQARSLLPIDGLSARMVPVAWLTPAEALAAGAACWVAGWVLVAWSRTRVAGWGLLALGVAGAGVAGYVSRRYAEPTAVVLTTEVPLRSAPYGSAPGDRRVFSGNVVRVLGSDGGWLLVERSGARGWVLPGEVARL